MLVLVSGALSMVAHGPVSAPDVRADSASLRPSGLTGPTLSISTANLSGATRVALFAEWGPSVCAVASGWYRWSLAEPASTQTLAGRHGLAPSTVSEHLTILHQAGLITRRRHRHEVMYAQTRLGTDLAEAGDPDGRS